MNTEFGVDAFQVVVDGVDIHEIFVAQLFVGHALAYAFEDIKFIFGDTFFEQFVDSAAGKSAGMNQPGKIVAGNFDSRVEIVFIKGLDHIAHGIGVFRLLHDRPVVVGGEKTAPPRKAQQKYTEKPMTTLLRKENMREEMKKGGV